MMLSKYALAFGLATLTSLGGGDRSQRPIIRTTNSLPNMQAVDRFYAFNFLSPDLNEIDGSSAGNSFYTAWDLGYGSEWNNLVSQPITYAQNSPRPGDGRYSLNGQTWNNGLDGNGLPHGGLVDSLGLRQVGLTVSVAGSFSTYNTGSSPYDTAANGVPAGWNHTQTGNPGSMGLSHLWLDARPWNNTGSTVRIKVNRLDPGRYALVLWLNPTDHDPLRSAKVNLSGQEFRFDHLPGADYPVGNRMILTDIHVPANSLSFQFSTFQSGATNMDSSLAGFAMVKLH